ncbi:MAG: ferrochelatase, partial [Alphaproteobacteria bacterium]|nr:ferrochelatase [Alphaproteobacteria bacterium]
MKTAVLLCSMGGPKSLKAVRSFLFHLFYDPAILRCANPLRWIMATLISTRRASLSRKMYKKIGGASPLVANTRDQVAALEKKLATHGNFRCFIGMSYSQPFIREAMEEINIYKPDHLIVVPLYPQFSTTTSQSVFDQIKLCLVQYNIKMKISELLSFQTEAGFVSAICHLMTPIVEEAQKHGNPRILFSAHGVPESVVKGGDPYPFQCQETVDAILAAWSGTPLDHVLCYQSKVGRRAWIGPSNKGEIQQAATARRPIVVVPTAFVS